MSDAAVYAHEMSMADLAEPLGFDSLWSAEHHFDDYTNMTLFAERVLPRPQRIEAACEIGSSRPLTVAAE